VSWSPSLGISTRLACTPPREASQHHEQHPPGCLLNAHQTRSHPEPRALGGGEARRGSVRCSGREGVGTEDLPMSSAENGYCSSDLSRAESPRSRRRRRTRSRLAPGPSASATSATSPPRCRRRCWQLSAGPDGIHHLACLMCASLLHMGGERERESRS
jgi:hypothetical protein